MNSTVKVIITYKSGKTRRATMTMNQYYENQDKITDDSPIEKIEIDRKRK